MKKTFTFVAAFGILASLFSSCEKENTLSKNDSLASVKTITVSSEQAKTILNGGLTPLFTADDRIIVGGKDAVGEFKKFTFAPVSTEYADPDAQTAWPSATAKFACADWDAACEPVYATDTYGSTSVSFTATTVTTLVGFGANGSKQNIKAAGSYCGRSACHVGKFDEGGSLLKMKNVNALLGFKLSSSDIKTVRFEAVGGEKLSGWVTIDIEKFYAGDADFYTLFGSNNSSVIILGSGFTDNEEQALPFPANEMLYASLIPGTLAQGLKITFTKTDLSHAERTISSSLTFKAGEVRNISSAIDEGLTWTTEVEGTLPDEFTMDMNFSNNPFLEDIKGKTDQVETGEDYTFRMDLGTEGSTHYYKDFTFGIFKGPNGNTYSVTSGFLGFERVSGVVSLGGIKLPAPEGYYLKAVSILNPMSEYPAVLTDAYISTYDDLASHKVAVTEANVPQNEEKKVFEFDSTSGIQAGKQYFLYRFPPSASTVRQYFRISTLKITYAKSLPAPVLKPIVMTMADANYYTEPNVAIPTRSTFTDGVFYHNSYPDYKFEGKGAKWSAHLTVKSGSCLKLPAISGYKLTQIVITNFKPTTDRKAKITNASGTYDDLTAVSGGEELVLNNSKTAAEMTWNLTDTYKEGTDYYLACGSELALQWTLTYTPVSDLK